MRKRLSTLAVPALILGFAAVAIATDPNSKLPPVQTPIEAANIPHAYVVITGTVSVRVDGVLVNPSDVTYTFDPEFKFSTGYLDRVEDGIYVLRADRVPADGSYTLTIKAAYNDTLIKDGVVQRMGKTRTGSLRIPLPFGRDYSIDQQLLDLQ
jgi:hypothetical protein